MARTRKALAEKRVGELKGKQKFLVVQKTERLARKKLRTKQRSETRVKDAECPQHEAKPLFKGLIDKILASIKIS